MSRSKAIMTIPARIVPVIFNTIMGIPPFLRNFIIFKGWCKVLKRLLSLVSAFAFLFFVSAPAFATGTGMEIGGIGGIPVAVTLDVVDFANYVRDDFRWCANTVANWIDEDVCPYAPQLGGCHNFVARRTLVDGQMGRYNVCEYCGKSYGDALKKREKMNSVHNDVSNWTPEGSKARLYQDTNCTVCSSGHSPTRICTRRHWHGY